MASRLSIGRNSELSLLRIAAKPAAPWGLVPCFMNIAPYLRNKLQFGTVPIVLPLGFRGCFLETIFALLLAALVVSSKNNFQLYFQIFSDDTELGILGRMIFVNSQSNSWCSS